MLEHLKKSLNWWLVAIFTIYLVYLFQAFSSSNSSGINADPLFARVFYWGSSAVNIIGFVLVAWKPRAFERLFTSKNVLLASGLVCAVGTLLMGFTPAAHDAGSWVSVCFSAVSTGLCTAYFGLLVGLALLSSGGEGTVENALAAYLLALIINAAMSFATGMVSTILVSLLPILFTYLFMLKEIGLDRTIHRNAASQTKKDGLAGQLVRFGICITVFSLLSGVMRAISMSSRGAWTVEMALGLAVSAIVVVVLVAFSCMSMRRADAIAVYRAVFFVAVVALAVLILRPNSTEIALGVQRASGDLFRVLVFIFASKIALRTAYHPLSVFGWSLALQKTVLTLSSLFATSQVTGEINATALGLLTIVAITFLYLFIFTEYHAHQLMETTHTTTIKEANSRRCAVIADRYGLSPREREVLDLYSRGKTVTAISEELMLSDNTVNMYRKKIYAKLDIHSKQELLDMLEAVEA